MNPVLPFRRVKCFYLCIIKGYQFKKVLKSLSLCRLCLFCFDMNVFTYLVYWCVYALPCLWVYVPVHISSWYNNYSDWICLFRFCIGFCLIFMYIHIMSLFTNYLLASFIYKISFMYNIYYFNNKTCYKLSSIFIKFWFKLPISIIKIIKMEINQKKKNLDCRINFWESEDP